MAAPGGHEGVGVDAGGYPVRDPTENVKELVKASIERLDDLREVESRHVREVINLEAKHAEELRIAEAKRIDAIRTVDVQAVQQAATVAAAQASTLAAQVATSAETQRATVAAAATASATALATALAPLTEAIADLRRVQYEQQGQRIGTAETRTDSRERGIDSRALVALGFSAALFVLSIVGFVISLAK